MPSTSKKQHNFMAAIANNPAFAKKVGIPQSVGSDFTQADKGRKFAKGGDTMATKGVNPFAQFQKSKKAGEAKGKPMKSGMPKMGGMPMKDGGGVKKMAAGGTFRASANGIAQRGKTKAAQPKMAGGGKC
jgi:hypothetical protein